MVILLITLQQTAGPWGLTTPMPGGIGAGHQPLGLRSWCQTCCAPFETRGQTRVCQSASETCSTETDQCPTPWLFFSLHLPTVHFLSLHFHKLSTLEHYSNEPGTVCEVGLLSQNLSVNTGQWDVIHMPSNAHISVFFRESYTVIPSLHLCCF